MRKTNRDLPSKPTSLFAPFGDVISLDKSLCLEAIFSLIPFPANRSSWSLPVSGRVAQAIESLRLFLFQEHGNDLVAQDPWFLPNSGGSTSSMARNASCSRHRYAVVSAGVVRKACINADLSPEIIAPFQNVHDPPELRAAALGEEIVFRRPLNPQARGYFLHAAQMQRWVQQSYFGERYSSFIGPLEVRRP